jgi:hypothetical protein
MYIEVHAQRKRRKPVFVAHYHLIGGMAYFWSNKQLSCEFGAALCAARIDDAATCNSCHACAETMTAFANQFAGLICAFHGANS